MNSLIRPAIAVFLLLTIVTGIAYPLLVTGVAQVIFPHQANGSLIRDEKGKVVGSVLIGQPFDGPQYFWSRPSATSPFADNAAASSGSNFGPTNPDLIKTIGERVGAAREANLNQTGPVPADLATASASGLDPHISPMAAEYQLQRIATNRDTSADEIRKMVNQYTEERTLGVLGEPRVNVLNLNRELDRRFPVVR